MPDRTDRLELNTFAQGETDWDHTDTVEALDKLAVERDVISSRPSEGHYDDELFFATDQRTLYRWDATESTWSAVGGLGASGDRIPDTLYIDGVKSRSLSTAHATVNNQLSTDSVPHIIYVRSDGDDGNDGLSESSAVATIDQALALVLNIPLKADNGSLPTHVVDLEAGATFTTSGQITYSMPWAGMLRIRSSKSGTPATIEIGSGVSKGFHFNQTRISFKDILLEAEDPSNRPRQIIQAHHHSELTLRGRTTVRGATYRQIDVDRCSSGLLRHNSVVEGQGKSDGSAGIRTHGSSIFIALGTVKNTEVGMQGTRNAAWALQLGTIDNCNIAMVASDSAVGKTGANATISNCETVMVSRGDGELKINKETTLSNNGTLFAPEEDFGTLHREESEYIIGVNHAIKYKDST